jgi:hypothetical protein
MERWDVQRRPAASLRVAGSLCGDETVTIVATWRFGAEFTKIGHWDL